MKYDPHKSTTEVVKDDKTHFGPYGLIEQYKPSERASHQEYTPDQLMRVNDRFQFLFHKYEDEREDIHLDFMYLYFKNQDIKYASNYTGFIGFKPIGVIDENPEEYSANFLYKLKEDGHIQHYVMSFYVENKFGNQS